MAGYRLTAEGLDYLKNGLPEKNLFDLLSKGEVKVQDAKDKTNNFNIALQWLKKKGAVEIKNGIMQPVGSPVFEEERALEDVNDRKNIDEKILSLLIERKLVEKVREDIEQLESEISGQKISQLTPDMIRTGVWKKAGGFLPYNTEMTPTKKSFQGKMHPYRKIINDFRERLIGLGFKEVRGSPVESEFWNFDALFIPQDHPARSGLHDSFVVKGQKKSKVLDKDLWSRVEETHKSGWITGSTGWGKWNIAMARQLILRSHNTATSARMMSRTKSDELPSKLFSIDRVFRHDVIDARHLIDFDQFEGVIMGEGLTFSNLLGYLKEVGGALGAERVVFKPSYFPFTEPSLEIYVEIKGVGLVEIGGAGMMRPEVTLPLGIEVPVLAWGIGIGRLAMIKLGIKDIRQLYSNDIRWLRDKPLTM